MLGPYIANSDGTISYRGNNIFKPIKSIDSLGMPLEEIEERVNQFDSNEMWAHISKINHQINISVNEYFSKIGALFTLLPLTTRMISSPGAVYGRGAINYTTDTCPVTIKWFDLPKIAFLSESSQIYLELTLVQKNVDQVYSIYNSFRKEEADFTHLSEFHHIEYEGKINQKENEKIILGLLRKILTDLLEKNIADIRYFLNEERITELRNFINNIFEVPKITFKEALELLYRETRNEKYKSFTLEHFGAWEEIRITETLQNMVVIKEYPLLEVPFYHSSIEGKESNVADNADFIWPGYRETIGSGHRVRSQEELDKKAKIFNLPREDYEPYLQTRELKGYKPTSGFGIGWERFLQGLLEMPFIWSAVHFPRVHKTLKP